MPDKHFYFSIGASIGTAISIYGIKSKATLEEKFTLFKDISKNQPEWTLYFPGYIFLMGLWGLVPDILHALRILPKEVTRSEIFNIFFFHSYFEEIESKYPHVDQWLDWTGEILLITIAIGTMCYYISQINKAVKSRTNSG